MRILQVMPAFGLAGTEIMCETVLPSRNISCML